MNDEQLHSVPSELLHPGKPACVDLIAWLRSRGRTMTLLELEQERRRRGIRGR